ncbi:MAG: hypothetical protein Hyperionvirus18_10 [Hyperionvirus sp.]|uniref:Microbial-type PARG catalytic domain-containing protein n=1 Tax=Hyperionvirus sp. TaxID=2487770 RepID=A0A3G5AC34_9VIRU|nr:MAG: hypothetical protein Hyperionvirus18_10 [Hyperionvirus sp.]
MNREQLKKIGIETESYFPAIREKYPVEIGISLKGTVCYDSEMVDKMLGEMKVPVAASVAVAAAPAVAAAAAAPSAAPLAAAAGETERKLPPAATTAGATVEVVNMDILDCAIKIIDAGYNPAVLNMASDKCLGGGFKSGASAGEEEMFRRTSYGMLLTGTKIKKEYPLAKNQCIYSPNILAFRANRKDNYFLLDSKDCRWVNFIAMPAIRNPTLVDGKYTKEDETTMFDKIRTIFKVALIHKHDSLVLSSVGCGAYNNPPSVVATIFKQVIAEFKTQFKHVAFAIISDRNDKHGNYKIFKAIIES